MGRLIRSAFAVSVLVLLASQAGAQTAPAGALPSPPSLPAQAALPPAPPPPPPPVMLTPTVHDANSTNEALAKRIRSPMLLKSADKNRFMPRTGDYNPVGSEDVKQPF